MASGSFSKNITSHPYQLIVEWSSTPTTSSNSSVVKATIKLKCPYSLSISGRSDNTISINGKTYYYDSPTVKTSGGTYTLGTVTSSAIAHNSDGSKDITITAKFKLNATISGTYYSTVTASKSVALDDIPRASTVSTTSSVYVGEQVSMTVTKKVNTYSHTLAISYDGGSTYENLVTGFKGATYKWTVPQSVYNKIPKNATSVTATIRCTTYSGTTTIGTATDTTIIRAVKSECSPSISVTGFETVGSTQNYTGDTTTVIKGRTGGIFSVSATAIKGAMIKSIYTYVDGERHGIYTSSSGSSASVNRDTEVYAIKQKDWTFYVQDTRGYTSSVKFSINILDYFAPTCTISASPSNPESGKSTLKISGKFWNHSFGAKDAALKVLYRYRTKDGEFPTAWTSLTSVAVINGENYSATTELNLDYTQEYVIQASATDGYTTGEANPKTLKTFLVFDWGENDFRFNVNAIFPNGGLGVRGIDLNGNEIQALQPCNSNGNLTLGYGNYSNGEGATHVYGDTLRLISNNDILANGCTIATNKMLWEGSYYMSTNQVANLSENISAQAVGVVLVFSRYDIANSTELNEHFSYHFIPKVMVSLQNGKGNIFNLSTSNETFAGSKYLYVYNDRIEGHANNTATGTGNNGVIYNNNRWVLRYVIGV